MATTAMMPAYQGPGLIPITSMPPLVEAVDKEDDWTGVTDAAVRRRTQTRLNTRAWRKRKALGSKEHNKSTSNSRVKGSGAKLEGVVPCWIEDQQTVHTFSKSRAHAVLKKGDALLPQASSQTMARVIFPLSLDHLITLVQFNVLRASLANRELLSAFNITNSQNDECSSAALRVLPSPSPGLVATQLPPSLQPTLLQCTVPHEGWVDIIPHPIWRDNVMRAIGTFDEDELWADTIGGLFDGFPASECENRGLVAWSPPWEISGWEISEGFWRKWGWTLKGCQEALDATNKWRRERGEAPLIFEV